MKFEEHVLHYEYKYKAYPLLLASARARIHAEEATAAGIIVG